MVDKIKNKFIGTSNKISVVNIKKTSCSQHT